MFNGNPSGRFQNERFFSFDRAFNITLKVRIVDNETIFIINITTIHIQKQERKSRRIEKILSAFILRMLW